MYVPTPEQLSARVSAAVDTHRLIELVQQVCRIPSVLGEEGELAGFLQSVMAESGFEAATLQPVLPGRPNALGELSFGTGPRVVLTGHLDTKPVSHGWTATSPFSGELLGGSIYGHGIMDMKAALACQIVAMEALRDSGAELAGTVAMAAVADHMGDQLGSIAYFDGYPADMAVLGELSDNEIFLGHRGRYYFDVTLLGKSAHTCHKPLAVNANALAAHAILELEASRFMPELEDWVRDLFGPETFVVPGRVYGGLPPGGPSMIPDECVIRVDCRPQPGVSVADVRAEVDRCLDRAGSATRGCWPRSCWPTSRTVTWPDRTMRWSGTCATRSARSAPCHPGPPPPRPPRPRRPRLLQPVLSWAVPAGGRAGAPGGGLAGRHGQLRREGADGHLRARRRAGVLPGRAPERGRHHRGHPGLRQLRRPRARPVRGLTGMRVRLATPAAGKKPAGSEGA